jgi:aerobic-type carbon monoxide dehydrogenase small subunit (CoxS/CutS family)
MATLTLNINGKPRAVDVDPATPMLWVLRDTLGLTGTKFGCGIGQCGACTILLDGRAVRGCQTPASGVGTKRVTTIEGLAADKPHIVQQAWIDEDAPQCGYCQPGMIMATVALLAEQPKPSDADIDRVLSRHICRCGTYVRIRRAVHRAAASGTSDKTQAAPSQQKVGG